MVLQRRNGLALGIEEDFVSALECTVLGDLSELVLAYF
jgi:hypothetical protein